MTKVLNLFAVLTAIFAFGSCENSDPVSPTPPPADESQPFKIEVYDLHASYCKVRFTPLSDTAPYWCFVATEDYLKDFGSMDNLTELATNLIETDRINNPETSFNELLHTGVYERDVNGLNPGLRFVALACNVNELGAVVSDVVTLTTTAPEASKSSNTFTIEVDQITATSAKLFITPSNDDPYVWMELPEELYQGKTNDEIEEFLLRYYKVFFPSHTRTGEMVYSFDDKLDPETEYMVIVFGYDNEITTELTTCTFRTGKPGDASNVTFEIAYSDLSSHSVSVTVTPSDLSVAYLTIVVDEYTLADFGGATQEGVKELISVSIEEAIESGECENRADFMESYAQRGVQTGHFGLSPNTKHYTCVVAVDNSGNLVSQVAISEFTAPEEGTTDAAVSASYDKYFDGSALAQLNEAYLEFNNWAIVPMYFTLSGSATDAIYTVYPASTIEEEGATDEDIRKILLDDNIEYNFFAEDRADIQLEWDCDYKLFMIAIDEDENVSELFTLDIPALSKEGASPASEYVPR